MYLNIGHVNSQKHQKPAQVWRKQKNSCHGHISQLYFYWRSVQPPITITRNLWISLFVNATLASSYIRT